MANAHRTNVLVTSCLKTPVDPHTKVPLASYERERVLPYTATGHMDNRDYEKELEYEDSGSDFCDEDYQGKGGHHMVAGYRAAGDRLDLSEIFFSNEEYYSKLEELKKAHLRTMAELESMYRQKLQLKSMEPFDMTKLDTGHRLQWANSGPAASCHRLRKSHSAVELRWSSGQSDSSDEDEAASNDVEKGLLFSPKEHIKNMWRDFKLSPYSRRLSSSSLHSLPGGQRRSRKRKEKKRPGNKDGEQEHWKHRVTIPRPFQMTLREAERRKHGVKTRSEIELENRELRRQLEELTECQRKFRASPVPAHVHLPLYEELQGRNEERLRTMRERQEQHLRTVQKPFSFLERERLKKEQKQLRDQQLSDQQKVKPFKAKPVPKSVYAAASGEQMKEEQLYRSIKIQMRAQEMLHSASMPPSMLTRRLSERKKAKEGSASAGGEDSFSHRPQINKEVPDFDASYRRFQKHLEKRKEVKPTTACEPFELKTSQISSHRDRILADIEKEQSSPQMLRWPYISSGPVRTPNSSLCSSLSGSLELIPAKATDATKKRHEAVRKVLEQRKRAEEEEERWRESQKQKEKRLQRVVLKRAQANDTHLALSQTHQSKLKDFRKQDFQRRREYQLEIKEMQQRVKGRPLLLEQVAQKNAKHAAEKRYTKALHGCDVTEEFISSKAAKSGSARRTSPSSDSKQSDLEEMDAGHEPVHYRKVFLDDEDMDDEGKSEEGRDREVESDVDATGHHTARDSHGDDHHYSDESYHYSDDHENYSDDSEHEADAKQQEARA
ncbi:protein FAM161A isoform X1 [Acanthochromis polyacanthus]|uniref:protein FAM161A isoform X1 n=1 Tax=Acanthochromis polyacanthus TaxID=80966 RepID=UPI002234001E|nr:protein FAM161A isoform X1 [Acanthochromis polyacanthus]